MAVDKRELLLDLLARDKSKQATDSFSKNMGGAADAADEATEATERLSKAAKENVGDIAKLDREIGLAEKELESLARAFARTDDAAERLDLAKVARKLEADLKRLRKNKGVLEGLLPTPADIAGPAQAAGRSLMKSIGDGLTSAGASVATKAGASVGPVVGGAIAAAAAPVLVSALGSALSAGAGAGVIGAGIALAVKSDKGIQQAGAEMGKKLIGGLQQSAGRNFSKPIRQSLGILEDAGERVARKWDQAFSDLSGSVVPLTKNLVQAGERINDSLTRAAGESGPALDGLGDSVRLLSDGLGDFIDTASDGGPEAAANLRLVAGATADMVRMQGNFLGTLNELSNNPWLTGPLIPLLRKHYGETADATDELTGATEGLPPALDGAAAGVQGVSDAAVAAKDPLATFIQQLQDSVEAGQSLYDSETDVAEAIDRASEAAKENGRTTDANTEKGRNNREALSGLATALRDNYTKYIQLNGAGGQANVVAEQNRAAFIRAAIQFGKTAREARELADDILGIPKTVGTRASFIKTRAEKEMLVYIAMLKRIPAHKRTIVETARVVTNYTGSTSGLKSAIDKQNRRAAGGPVRKDEAYLVGEKRAEVFVPDRDGKIIPSVEEFTGSGVAQRMSSGGGSAGVQQLVLSVAPGGNAALQALLQALLPYLRTEVRTAGAGSVQRLLGVKGVA